MKNKAIEITNDLCEYIEKWKSRLKAANESLESVNELEGLIKWRLDAIRAIPDDAEDLFSKDIINVLKYQSETTKNNLPMLPIIDQDSLMSSVAYAMSGSSMVLSRFINQLGDEGSEEHIQYGKHITDAYQILQDKHDLKGRVRQLIITFNWDEVLNRYDRALRAFEAFKSGVGERTAAAIEIRTFLDGVKGELFELSRKTPNEKIDWQVISKRLISDTDDSHNRNEIIRQGTKVRPDIYDKLSKIAKGYEGKFNYNLENVFSQVLDHVFILLQLIEKPYR